MGTGYERQSWLHMLDEESLGSVFGFANTPYSTEFVQASHNEERSPSKIVASVASQIYTPLSPPTTATPATSSRSRSPPGGDQSLATNSRSSLNSSPAEIHTREHHLRPTSPTPSHTAGLDNEAETLLPVVTSQRMKISRAYRLLPNVPWEEFDASQARIKGFKPRVYLQGIAEETHGISDTLLSVVSIRAGEVMDDLFQSQEESGTSPRAGRD